MRTALSIAGTDPSGGAGIQADLKTMTMNGVFAMSAITALVAQNTTGVWEIAEVEPRFLGRQIDAVFADIPPDAIKVGMAATRELIEMIAERLRFYRARNVVVDPVMVATSGGRLLSPEAVDLNGAVEEAVAALYGAFIEAGIVPRVSLPPERVARSLDRAALSRVLGNLLANALKYSAGDLDVVLSPDGAITLSNAAPALDEVQVGRLFDRFYTVGTGRRRLWRRLPQA